MRLLTMEVNAVRWRTEFTLVDKEDKWTWDGVGQELVKPVLEVIERRKKVGASSKDVWQGYWVSNAWEMLVDGMCIEQFAQRMWKKLMPEYFGAKVWSTDLRRVRPDVRVGWINGRRGVVYDIWSPEGTPHTKYSAGVSIYNLHNQPGDTWPRAANLERWLEINGAEQGLTPVGVELWPTLAVMWDQGGITEEHHYQLGTPTAEARKILKEEREAGHEERVDVASFCVGIMERMPEESRGIYWDRVMKLVMPEEVKAT